MLNPSLKSRLMEKFNRFSRILAGLIGYKISPLENKKRSNNKKTLKNAFFIKVIKNVKNVFYIYVNKYVRVDKLGVLSTIITIYRPTCTSKCAQSGPPIATSNVNILLQMQK